MFKNELLNVLGAFVKTADELDLKWKREGEDLFSLQIFFKTKSRMLLENKLYFNKETVATDLAGVVTTLIKMATEVAPGISLKVDGIPGIDNRAFTLDEILKPSLSGNGFTLVAEEEEEDEEYDGLCHCPACVAARARIAEEETQSSTIEEILGLSMPSIAVPRVTPRRTYSAPQEHLQVVVPEEVGQLLGSLILGLLNNH